MMGDEQTRSDHDLSWVAFAGVMFVQVLAAALLLPAPSRGPGGKGLVPGDCLPSLTIAFGVGLTVVFVALGLFARVKPLGRARRRVALASAVTLVALCFLWPAACHP